MSVDQIQCYLRSVASRDREAVSAGAFVLYVHPTDRHPFLNYAIPAPGAVGGDGSELVRAARERGLLPRLEYLDACFPWVEEALAVAGFTREGRLRLMTCSSVARLDAGNLDLARVETSSPLAGATLAVTRAAFGEPPPKEADLFRWRGPAIAGIVDSEVVGAAAWTPVIDGMSEIVGVVVAQSMRRRGIGSALTVAATQAAFEEGATLALLTPGDDDTARVYERAGFRNTTTMLHLSCRE
jgi:GNAT superfamily N-acetyltransferase